MRRLEGGGGGPFGCYLEGGGGGPICRYCVPSTPITAGSPSYPAKQAPVGNRRPDAAVFNVLEPQPDSAVFMPTCSTLSTMHQKLVWVTAADAVKTVDP